MAVVYDRPRRPPPLAEGINRKQNAVLMSVCLHLPQLIAQAKSSLDESTFLQKLGSLARLALSAASQKREFLRRHGQRRPGLTAGFLLERARLNVVPIGLEAVVRFFHGQGLCAAGPASQFGLRVIHRLLEVLQEDGRARALDVCLDSLTMSDSSDATPEEVMGLTPHESAATAKSQLREAGLLHAPGEAGTATVLLSEDQRVSPDELVELLRYGWQQTDAVRVKFARFLSKQKQGLANWEPGGTLSL